jgi:2-desacetyl-2-hydroxyethyl bacteriochlorophyllide A dehydrogenase
MKAAVLYAPGDLRVVERPVPTPDKGWVVIAVEAAGICGTDVAVYKGEHSADLPRVMGHEFAGRILAVGDGVSGLVEGQRVMAEGSWRLAHAEPGGSSQAMGRTVDGCFAEAVAAPVQAVHPLPPTVSAVAAQSVTTVATAIHAVDRAGDLDGMRIAIVGPGHAGLLLMQTCLVSGAAEATVLGTRDNRLALAHELGAVATANVRDAGFDEWLQGVASEPFDVVFEASGTPSGLALSFQLARLGGRVVCYGIINASLDGVPGEAFYAKELTVIGSRGAGQCYDAAIELLASGDVHVEPLVSHLLPLNRANEGFRIVTMRLQDVMRLVYTR